MNDKELYVQVEKELAGEPRKYTDRALWTKAKTLAKGDEEKTKYTYIELRVEELKEKAKKEEAEELTEKAKKEEFAENKKELAREKISTHKEHLESELSKEKKSLFVGALGTLIGVSLGLCLLHHFAQYSTLSEVSMPNGTARLGEFFGAYLAYLLVMGVLGGISYGIYKAKNPNKPHRLLLIPFLGIALMTFFTMFVYKEYLEWFYWSLLMVASFGGILYILGGGEKAALIEKKIKQGPSQFDFVEAHPLYKDFIKWKDTTEEQARQMPVQITKEFKSWLEN